jgi:DNA-binding MarR family transcriptional regulator
MSAFNMYHRAAMAQIEMPSSESFFFLNGIAYHGEIKKTDLINYLFFEYTTGMEAINKLLKNEFIKETVDSDDKRAKLLCLTEKGKELLKEGYRQSTKVSEMIFKDVSADAIRLANQLLGRIEQKHSKLVASLKNAEFDKMHKTVCG